MENGWDRFVVTGSVEDYLAYCRETEKICNISRSGKEDFAVEMAEKRKENGSRKYDIDRDGIGGFAHQRVR